MVTENMIRNMLEYTVQPGDGCVFLRDVFKRQLQVSRSLLKKLKYQERITVNGRIARTDYRLQAGDRVEADIGLVEACPFAPQYLPLRIVYEDCDFLAVDKPPGLKTHPNHYPQEMTLAHAVAYYLEEQGLKCRFRPASRLDKDTSGLVLVGKSQFAHQAIAWQRKKGLVSRRYEAIVEGTVSGADGRIDLPIAHLEPEKSPRRSVDARGRAAITNYLVKQHWNGHTRLELSLETGRTHQIRVHLSHCGYPICGDRLYGSSSPLIDRQALHAAELSFIQPRTGLRIECSSPLPADMQKLIAVLNE